MLVVMVVPACLALLYLLLRSRLTAALDALSSLRLRGLWLVWVAALVQILRTHGPSDSPARLLPADSPVAMVAVVVPVVVFVALNYGRCSRGARLAMALVVAGAASNTAAMLANGGMPFSRAAARTAGLPSHLVDQAVPGHPPLTPDSHLVPLTDLLPVPWVQKVVSIGDLLLVVGLCCLVVALARSTRRPPAPGEEVIPCPPCVPAS